MGLLAWLLMPRVSSSVTASIQLLARPRNPCRTKKTSSPNRLPGDAQFFEGGSASREISARHQREQALDTSRLERDALASLPFDRHPGLTSDPFAFDQADGG